MAPSAMLSSWAMAGIAAAIAATSAIAVVAEIIWRMNFSLILQASPRNPADHAAAGHSAKVTNP
jgi:hypothetical protein